MFQWSIVDLLTLYKKSILNSIHNFYNHVSAYVTPRFFFIFLYII